MDEVRAETARYQPCMPTRFLSRSYNLVSLTRGSSELPRLRLRLGRCFLNSHIQLELSSRDQG